MNSDQQPPFSMPPQPPPEGGQHPAHDYPHGAPGGAVPSYPPGGDHYGQQPPPPGGYYPPGGGQPPLPPKRPVAIKVLGILNIVFGVLGLCCGMLAGLGGAVMLVEEGVEGGLMVVIALVLVLSTILLLAGGIGLLMYRAWGRTVSLIAAVLFLIVGVLDLATGIVFQIQPALANAGDDTEMVAMAIGGALGVCCGAAIRIAYPVVLFYFLNKPELRQHLN